MLKKAIIGICAGFITGLFSTGGGMIVLPALIYFLKNTRKSPYDNLKKIYTCKKIYKFAYQ